MNTHKTVADALRDADALLKDLVEEGMVGVNHSIFPKLTAAQHVVATNPLPQILAALESENSEDLERAVAIAKAQMSESRIKEALRDVGFKSFTKDDWSAYAGCESPDPLIKFGTNRVIVYDVNADGQEILTVMNDGDTWYAYRLVKAYND